METAQECPKTETIKVGPDQVTIGGDKVTIDARHIFADWQVREYSRIPIYFQEKKYFLRQKSPGQKPFAMRYVLELWPADSSATTSRVMLEYSEQVVAEREAAIRGGHYEDVGKAALLLVFPFLGMLWSGTKLKLARFGIISRTVTGISIMITFGLIMLDGVFAKMLMMGGIRSGKAVVGGIIRTFAGKDYFDIAGLPVRIVWLDCALFVILVADLLIRYSQHLRDEEPNFGFLEWAFRSRTKLREAHTCQSE
jgi:hypothetical protein